MAKRKMPKINEKQYVVSLETAIDVLETGWAERENENTGKWLVAEDDYHRFATRTETKFLDAAEAKLKKTKIK